MAHFSPTMTIMIRAAEKAARSLIRDFGEVEQLQVSQKGPGDFVSAADHRAEKIIHEELSKSRPGYGFLMEESGEIKGTSDPDYVFIIDPLDGTSNFLHGIPHWCISIGLEHKGEIVAGVVYDPVKDELFSAEKGGGAFMRHKRLRVSGRRDMHLAFLACGQPRPNAKDRQQFLREYNAMQVVSGGVRRFGAAALDLAYVAAGRYEAYWERGLKSWDAAAGFILVREAGGYVTDIGSNENPVYTGNLLAGTPAIHEQVRKLLNDVATDKMAAQG